MQHIKKPQVPTSVEPYSLFFPQGSNILLIMWLCVSQISFNIPTPSPFMFAAFCFPNYFFLRTSLTLGQNPFRLVLPRVLEVTVKQRRSKTKRLSWTKERKRNTHKGLFRCKAITPPPFSPSSLCMRAKSLQSCPTLCDPIDCRLRQAPLSMGFSSQEYWSG